MITAIENVNVPALKAAAMFASTDEARPIIAAVAVLDTDLFVATNSYFLGMVSKPNELPGDVIERVCAIDVSAGVLLLPVKDVDKMIKLLDPKRGRATGLTDTLSITVDGLKVTAKTLYGASMVFDRVDGEYPTVRQLLSCFEPECIEDCAFSPQYMGIICKAAAALSTNAVRFHGGVDALKPTYWSSVNENASLCTLLMPVRLPESAWKSAPVEAIKNAAKKGKAA